VIVTIMRHGIAETRDLGKKPDEARALTAQGRKRMRAAAAGLARLGVDPAEIVTSPLTRCRQTAEIVADALGLEGPREDDRLRPGARLDAVMDVIVERADADELLICGHEPDCSQIVADLVGGGDIEMRKGSVARIELAAPRPRGGTLIGLHAPRVLRRLAAD
jgi:phosphohistidine phosphatase